VDFSVGPDGSLWWLSQWDQFYTPASGTLSRIRYTAPTVADATAPTPPAWALRSSGNPFRDRLELSFRLGTAAVVRVSIVDVSGRIVRTVFAAEASSGETRLEWDGRDDAGQSVASGVYFARLVSGPRRESVPLIRVL
jgi:hypothetical protein